MKLIFSICLLSGSLFAQTNLIPFLHTAQGDFTEATITTKTPTYVIVNHPGGIAKVWMTNLPPEIQKQVGYDPAKAQATAEAEAKKLAAIKAANLERQKYLATLVGPVESVRAIAIIDPFGQCKISTSNGVQQVYMIGMPASVQTALVNFQKQTAAVAQQATYAEQLTKEANRADATAATGAYGSAAYVNAVMSQREAANKMLIEAKEAREDLVKMKEALADMTFALPEKTTFRAFNTGLKDNGISRWQSAD